MCIMGVACDLHLGSWRSHEVVGALLKEMPGGVFATTDDQHMMSRPVQQCPAYVLEGLGLAAPSLNLAKI